MRIAALMGLALCAGVASRAQEPIRIGDMGGWTIGVAEDASPSERYAAEEFLRLWKESTGIELAIGASAERRIVLIGPGASGLPVDDLGDEGLRIRIGAERIAIAGGRPRGTLYGVYEFFERYLGVRFLTWDDTYFPEGIGDKTLPCESYDYTPQFSFRWSYYKENSDRPDFAARMRVNTVSDDEKLGGKTPQNLINHSLFKWINPAKYGESHPEYFAFRHDERSLEAGGGGPEPCVTNPEVIDIVAQGVIADLDANPTVRNISVSQNDNDAYCRCDRCEALNRAEETPMGAQLTLVNAVADRVAEKHPQVKVGTLAYWYTRHAPKTIKPRDNVQIQLCSIECCTLHAINDPDCPRNRSFCKDMEDWKAICNDIWVWNYNTDFSCYDLPFPNLRSIGANVKFFLENNVKGVFMQANGNGNAGEMCDLRNYVISRCLWHPGQDSWPLVEEFCRLHYKGAAQPILDYLTMIYDNAQTKGAHPGCFPSAQEVGLDPEICARAIGYFRDAMAKADDDAVRARVEKASICAYKAMILAGGGHWEYADGVCKRALQEICPDAYERYVELAQKYGMTMASEGTAAGVYFEEMKRQAALPAARLENAVWRLTVLPGENGKMVELHHKTSGRDLFAGMSHAEIFKGAHDEIGMKGYDDAQPRAFEAKVEGNAVTLTKTLADGSTVVRTIALKDDAPDRVFFTSTLNHRGAEPKTYRFKAHPEFDVASGSADCNVVAAYVLSDGWQRVNRDWETDHGPDDAALKTAKGGAFAFYNHEAKFGVLVRYAPDEIDCPYLWWSPKMAQINLELVSPEVELAPGGSLAMGYSFEFLAEAPQ